MKKPTFFPVFNTVEPNLLAFADAGKSTNAISGPNKCSVRSRQMFIKCCFLLRWSKVITRASS